MTEVFKILNGIGQCDKTQLSEQKTVVDLENEDIHSNTKQEN